MTSSPLEFFESISDEYDRFIQVAVSRYEEMLWAMFYYLPPDFQPASVLELGCGTGILTRKIQERWPDCRITAVDISPEMMEHAKSRLGQSPVHFVEQSFETLMFPDAQFDLVMSNLAIHHITAAHKKTLTGHVYDWLKPGGFFIHSDKTVSNSKHISDANFALVLNSVQAKGAGQEEAEFLHHHLEVDQPSTLVEHLHWFEAAGFRQPEVLWRYAWWMVLQGRKSA